MNVDADWYQIGGQYNAMFNNSNKQTNAYTN